MNPDTRAILAAVAASPAGLHTLATVVRVEGSSYRRPGARMLVHASGLVAGSVSGGCLDTAIARRGRWWAERAPVIRRFTTTSDDADTPSPGCGGTIDIHIENVRADDPTAPLAVLREIASRRTPACLITPRVPDASRFREIDDISAMVVATGRSAWRRVVVGGEAMELFFEYVAGPQELLVVGRGHGVAPLVRMARLAGWEVTVAASGVATRALGAPDHVLDADAGAVAAWARTRPRAAIVVMTHDAARDRSVVGAILAAARPLYLGVLGPRHRTDELVRALDAPPAALAALRTPVGLDLGGDGPEAIALSIVAELQATWHGRSAARLCADGAWATPAALAAPAALAG